MTDKQLIKRLEARVKKLERALRPFAQEATNWAPTVSDGYAPGMTEPRKVEAYAKAEFCIGDLRRAHKLVATA